MSNKKFSVLGKMFFKLLNASLLILFLIPLNLFAQNFDTVWTKIYSGPGTDLAIDVCNSNDGGFIIAGYSDSFSSGDNDIYILKLDEEGDTIWTKNYGGSGNETARSIVQTNDGGFLTLGTIDSNGFGVNDFLLLKINEDGDELWTKTYGTILNEQGYSLVNASNNGFILAGNRWVDSLSNFDFYIVRIDQNGDTIWTRSVGGLDNDIPYSIQQTNDSGYVIGGSSPGINILKINSSGQVLWTRDYDFVGTIYSIIECSDGNLVAAGRTETQNSIIFKINELGDTLWTHIKGVAPLTESLRCIIELSNGNLLSTGIKLNSVDFDCYFLELDPVGNELYSQVFGGTGTDVIWGLNKISDFEILAVGYTNSFSPLHDIYILKLEDRQIINVNIQTEPIWFDSDYDALATGQVDGNSTTISYGSIISYEWMVDGIVVANESISQITLPTGSKYVTLKVTSDSGIVKQDSVLITVLAAIISTGGPISSAIGQLDGNSFFATSYDDQVYKFDSLGTINWNILTGGDIQSTTCISNQSNIYVGSSDTRLYCFGATGTPKWDRAMGGVIVSSPSVSNDSLIFVGVSTGRLFAVTESGTILWNYQTGAAINSSPSVSTTNDVYVGSDDGKLYSINSQGQLNWSFTTVDPVKSSPAISNDGSIVFGSNDGSVYKLNISGGMIWQYSAGGNIVSSPVIGSEGKIYFGSTNGKVFALSSSGNKLWEYDAGSSISGSPTLTLDENIIIGCDNGKLLALSSNGELNWYLQTNAALNAPPLITSNGLILIGGNDSKIYILKNPTLSLLENSSNVALEWPTFKGNNKRTGNKVETLTSVITEDENIPTSYSLLQNFPNPFNPSTKIFYALPNTGTVQIKVFDLLGQEIVTLVNETKAAGNYQINFNASSLPSGIYLYRIQAGNFVQTRKMILMK